MIARLLELITGKDDLERIACKEDLQVLNAYLKTRRVVIPMRPASALDAAAYTQEELMELIEKESTRLVGDTFEPWVLEVEGKKRLPVFSSQKKMMVFLSQISQDMNKVFGLGSAEFLLADIVKTLDIDFVVLNLFSLRSWEIAVTRQASDEPGPVPDHGAT
jgi:hypothetical protein